MDFHHLTEHVSCPLCDYAHNEPYAHEYPSYFEGEVKLGLNRCDRCSLQYISPRLNGAGLHHLYSRAYQWNTVSGANTTDPEISEREYETFLGYVRQYLPGGGKLLDVGCGVGNFLKKFPAGGALEVEGVEFSEYAAGEAVKAGLKVSSAGFLEQPYPNNHFDCAILLYVLEHLPRPRTAVEKVFALLRPGGYMLTAVPNYRYRNRPAVCNG